MTPELESTYIQSLQNDRIKNIVKLRGRRARQKQRLMIVEGYRCLLRALNNDLELAELYFCPALFIGENEFGLLENFAKRGTRLFEVSQPVFEKICYRDRPEGLLGLAAFYETSLQEIPISEVPFLVVSQAIEKPGNLGSIIRSADGTGADAVLVCDRCTDMFNPNVITASTGILFAMPTVECSSTETLEFLRARNIQPIAASPDAEKVYSDIDLSGPVAIVVGTEQYGLNNQWLNSEITQVRIPMLGQADSLNVANATTLLLYETLRQRQAKL